MNKDQAQRIIKDTFENKFDKARFTRFMVELLNLKSLAVSDHSVAFNSNQIPNAYQPFINSFEKIADYRSGEHKLDVLAIWLKKETSIERARTMQRNFIAWYLRGDYGGEMKDATLAAFVSPGEEDWRFSLVKIEYSLGEDKKGRVKISEEFTPAKRWSFLVGSNEKSHTAQSQLIDILAKDEINPTLTQLEESFNIETVTKEFFKKYKELFFWTKETFDELISKDSKIRSDFETKNINTVDFSKKLLGQIVFLYFLQKKGWFGVARDADWGTGPKNFLRELFKGKHGKYNNFYNDILEPLFYEALRNDRSYDDDYYRLFNCKIPFLNGGLFDPINNYDWVHTDINLPDDLFSNGIITKEGDTGTGILDIFDRYNFTVKEDEPLEKEVAVDPEMLGKVFENLLEVKDRKSKGTYYTPREIVHYMCQQSLINYLDTEMEEKVFKDDIEKLIKYGEQFGENNTDLIDSLKDIPKSIIRNAKLIDEKLTDIKVCDPAVGSGAFLVGMMGEIVRTRNVLTNYIKDSNRTIYNFKRDCIENSLYGVDIDPGAVEIAKLRLWLSLVVEEEDIKQIKPLPNLDYKIVCGNSLMSIEKNLFNQELFSELESLKRLLFDEINPNKKQGYKTHIDDLISQVTNGHKEFDFEIYFSEVFHEKKGFDIVIANPPYVRVHKQNKEQKEILKKIFTSPYKDFDIYIVFIEQAMKLLKENGILCFITPDKYLIREYGEKIRNYLFSYQLIEFYDVSRANDLFGAAVYPLITISKKVHEKSKTRVRITDSIALINNPKTDYLYPQSKWEEGGLIELIQEDDLNVINKITTNADKLKDFVEKDIFCGTPRARDYYAWARGLTDKHCDSCVKVLVCQNLRPYKIDHSLSVRTLGERIKSPFFNNSTNIISPKKWNDFLSVPKILIKGNDIRITAVMDNEPSVFIGIYGIKFTSEDKRKYIKFVLALLNSNLYQWIFLKQNSSLKIGGGYFSVNASQILRLPFKYPPVDQLRQFDNIVDKLLSKSYSDNYLYQEDEKQIDQLVYKLYNLTLDEIAIIEGKA